jgi:hypothetical protein
MVSMHIQQQERRAYIASKSPVILSVQNNSRLIVSILSVMRGLKLKEYTYLCNIACALNENVLGILCTPKPAILK